MPASGLAAGTEFSHYRIEELMARGGMGVVYRAVDVGLDRSVALKVLTEELSEDQSFRERFVRESRLAAAVDHPHVIPVYEAGDWEGTLYLAMRFVRGADLHTVLATAGPPDTATALTVLGQAALALDAAHEAGLVHRDVKPGNFLLAGATASYVPPTVHVYLTDFGLTKRATSVSGLTRTGQFLGSLHYVAPEQIRGEDVDARTDVYALACVAYETLTGLPPYDRDQDAALLWAHMSSEPPLASDVRPDLPVEAAEVLAAGMAKERHDRPETAGELIHQLREALGEQPAPIPAPRPAPTPAPATVQQARRATPVQPPSGVNPAAATPKEPAARNSRGRRWWGIAAAALLVAVVAVGLLVWQPWAGPDLRTRPLGVVPYQADLPAGWGASPPKEGSVGVTFGPPDLVDPALDDPDSLASAAQVAAEDPERLVSVYADPAEGLENETPDDTASQILSALPEGSGLTATGTVQIDGQDAVELDGVLRLSSDEELRIYGAALGGKILIICAAPTAIYDDWKPTFDQILGSVRHT